MDLEPAVATGLQCDGVVISFPKSGRTWLTFLVAYYGIYRLLGSDGDRFVDKMEFTYRPEHRLESLLKKRANLEGTELVPVLAFTHCLPQSVPYFDVWIPLEKVGATTMKAIQLVRDPRDVVVSHFHHVKARGMRTKHGRDLPDDVDISEFLRSETAGIRMIVEHMNQGVARAPSIFAAFRILHFEDLVADPARELRALLSFFGAASIDELALERAIGRATFDRLQRAEKRHHEKTGKSPLGHSLRFRRGRSGSHRDELGTDDIRYLESVLTEHLAPEFVRYLP